MPVSSGIVTSYVPGETTADAVLATADLVDDGLRVTLDYLGEDTTDAAQAARHGRGLQGAARRPRRQGPRAAGRGLGQAQRHRAVPARRRAHGRAGERPRHLPRRPQRRHHGDPRHGGPHHHRLDAVDPARAPQGLPRDRRRAPGDAAPHRGRLPRAGLRGLARAAVQGRLHGARATSPSRTSVEIDKSYVRCLKVLLGGQGYPMIATHDPRMVQIASSLASRFGRRPGTYEFQMLYGIRPEEQKRLAAAGRDRARLHPLRHRVVRLPHAPPRREAPEPRLLRALARLQEVRPQRPRRGSRHARP